MSRVLEGYLIAAVLAISTGILLGYFRLGCELSETLIEFPRPMPCVGMIPVVALVLGIGNFILDSQRRCKVPQMYAGMAAVAMLGYTLNFFVQPRAPDLLVMALGNDGKDEFRRLKQGFNPDSAVEPRMSLCGGRPARLSSRRSLQQRRL